MLDEDLVAIIKESYKTERRLKKEHNSLKSQISEMTGWIDLFYNRKIRMGTRIDFIYNDIKTINDIPKCLVCQKPVSLSAVGYLNKTCSTECAKSIKNKNIENITDDVKKIALEKRRKTCKEKYGTESPMQVSEIKSKAVETFKRTYEENKELILQRKRETSIKKYGKSWPTQSPEVMKKTHSTNMARYGFSNPILECSVKERHSASVRKINQEKRIKKIKETNLSKYGVECVFENKDIQEKIREKNLVKFGVINHSQKHIDERYLDSLNDSKELRELYESIGAYNIAVRYKINISTVYDYLHKHGIEVKKQKSSKEIALVQMLSEFGVDFVENDRSVLGGMELDIYIPEKKIAIEFNGIYWHSSKFKHSNYHLDKTKKCLEQGIRLIHIFEDEWHEKLEIIKNKIKSILGIDDRERVYARKCLIEKNIDKDDVDNFYEKTHIQGKTTYKMTYALQDQQGEFVAMMSIKENFGRYELVRFSTSKAVVGGFSKLFCSFVDDLGIDEIVSFADRRWSVGDVYEKNGFVLDGITKPSYSYVVGYTRMNKRRFRKEKLGKMIEKFDNSLSERDNTEMSGIYRIYDCGLLRYMWKRGKLCEK